MTGIALPSFVTDYLSWWIAGAIVVIGLLIYGFRDVARFSLRRAWAISGVCFDESIRRKVLWITPLAILGAVIVTQLQKPIDAQDAIRQTTKFCLFATGLVVTVTAIILASTNLPKEIENRVIYTIVTKPATRLEIVLGKVMGFARVSAAILLIMGVFIFAYLHLRAWNLRRDVSEQLAAGAVDPMSRPTLEYYRDAGLLTSRTFLRPVELQIFSRIPEAGDHRRWMFGADGEQSFAVPFEVTPEQLIPQGAPDAPPGGAGMFIRLNIGFQRSAAAEQHLRDHPQIPETIASPTHQPPPPDAIILVQITDDYFNTLVMPEQVNRGQPVRLSDPGGTNPLTIHVSPEATASILAPGEPTTRLFVMVSGASDGVEYFVEDAPNRSPVSLIVPGVRLGADNTYVPDPELRTVISPLHDPGNPDDFLGPYFRGRMGTYGQQLRGGEPGEAPVAVYEFRRRRSDPSLRPVDGRVPFELRVGIERSGETEDDSVTTIELTALNRTSGAQSDPIIIIPESSRTSYFSIAADAVGDGNFDLLLRNRTAGNYVGLLSFSVAAVASEQSFSWNLLKSLLIMWLMAILVVIVAIFCSTFLSWPIAIILSIVILLGHWAVLQLGEDAGPGTGARIATDIFGSTTDAARVRVVSQSVEALTRLLRLMADVLPDISRFAAVEDIERGVTISAQRIKEPLLVLAGFGLPMLVLSYVILRNKEVAP